MTIIYSLNKLQFDKRKKKEKRERKTKELPNDKHLLTHTRTCKHTHTHSYAEETYTLRGIEKGENVTHMHIYALIHKRNTHREIEKKGGKCSSKLSHFNL